MRLSRSPENGFNWEMEEAEYAIFLSLLKRYPLINGATKPLSGEADLVETDQQLLEDALAEHRSATRAELMKLMETAHMSPQEGGEIVLALKSEHVEPLLQVFNDVRVGSWLRLGSPELDKLADLNVSGESFESLWLMEMGGFFQSVLLEALEEEEG